jgi:DNA-directed RNA polymerase subunit H (RpoH/RPB5)
VDQVVEEPDVQFRIWDAEGAPVDTAADLPELRRVLDRLGVDPDELQQIPATDPWCE